MAGCRRWRSRRNDLRLRLILLLALVLGVAACVHGTTAPQTTRRVLFVGNSLTLYNDLPAKAVTLSSAADPPTAMQADLLAEAGGSLRDRLADGSLRKALSDQPYDVVVLQEFGGWPLCSTQIPACASGTASLEAATHLVRASGARPIWFGTWQGNPAMQSALSSESRKIAARIGLPYADAGAAVMAARSAGIDVLRPDGHPTHVGSWLAAGVLLDAITPAALLPSHAPTACGQHWEGTQLRGNRIASLQAPRARECNTPDPAHWTALRLILDTESPP